MNIKDNNNSNLGDVALLQLIQHMLEEMRKYDEERGRKLEEHVQEFKEHVKDESKKHAELTEAITKLTDIVDKQDKRIVDLEGYVHDVNTVRSVLKLLLKPVALLIIGVLMLLIGNGPELLQIILKGVM